MPKTHPYAEATYQVFADGETSFAIEVKIPDSQPTKVSPFATRKDAERWIAEHRRRVAAQAQSRGPWHRSRARGGAAGS